MDSRFLKRSVLLAAATLVLAAVGTDTSTAAMFSAPTPTDTALAAALALAGAPAGTTVTCVPGLEAQAYGEALGLSGGPVGILLAPPVCGGLLLLQATQTKKDTIARLSNVDVDRLEGIAALATLHEGFHISLHSWDETRVECAAMRLLPTLLDRYLSGVHLERAFTAARQYDQGLPAEYHASTCTGSA